MSQMFRSFPTQMVTIIHAEGTDDERRFEVEAHIQPKSGFFKVDVPIYEGDIVEIQDPRGGIDRRLAGPVDIYSSAPANMQHTQVTWAKAPPVRTAPVRRLGLEGLHPLVIRASSDLFVDGHPDSAVLEAYKALESRVRELSGLDVSGQDLMAKAMSGDPPPIDVRIEAGQSGEDEQEGFRFLLMGAVRGIRNPKAHEAVRRLSAEEALEYLAFASLLMRRIEGGGARP